VAGGSRCRGQAAASGQLLLRPGQPGLGSSSSNKKQRAIFSRAPSHALQLWAGAPSASLPPSYRASVGLKCGVPARLPAAARQQQQRQQPEQHTEAGGLHWALNRMRLAKAVEERP
jgi:hypothetical protein